MVKVVTRENRNTVRVVTSACSVHRDLVVSERDGKIQELKDTISQLNLERTELITKVTLHHRLTYMYVYMHVHMLHGCRLKQVKEPPLPSASWNKKR